MTKSLFLSLFFAASLQANAATVIDLNRGWLVNGTQLVNVPHDYLIEQPWVAPAADEKADNSDAGANIKSRLSARGFKELNSCTYTKTFTPSEDLNGKQLLLDFEGIMYVADVYLNDELIGGTDYGYVGFEIDVTRKLKIGQENTIKVVCEQGGPKDSRWYTGGGLYRNVTLVAKDAQMHFQRHPLYITNDDVTKSTNGTVNVSVSANVQNSSKQKEITLQLTILDPQGTQIYSDKHSLKYNRNYRAGQELTLPAIAIANAQLWDCEHPNLYTAKVQLLREDGSVADETQSTFGIRTVQIVPGKGLILNGKKVLLKGYANHHTLGALGAAAYPKAIEKRIKLMKEFGMNHIRTSHNPYSTSFLDICDKYGILVVDELYDKWNDQYVGAGRKHFMNLWQQHVPEFITRDRNHPCVVAWSMGNELQSYNDMPFNDFGVTQFKLMRTLVQRYDTTRKVTVAMHPRYRNWDTDSLPCNLAMVTDFQSYNYRYMYFPGDEARFPWMTFYQSEASVSAMGENFFAMDRDRTIGLAYWGAIDYLGESQGWPVKGWAQGVFDISLEAKPKAYYMRSFFKPDEPIVHIAVTDTKGDAMWNGVQTGNDGQSDHWNREPFANIDITTYTNAEEVELIVNGKSYGTQKNDISSAKMRNQIRWKNVIYHVGYCEAIARTGGKIVARHKIETTGAPTALKIESDNNAWQADGMDLQHLRIYAVDSKGHRVQTAKGLVTILINDKPAQVGDANAPVATLAAVSSGNHASDELNMVNSRQLFNGSILAILRAGLTPGNITVTATCPGLKSATVKLKTLPK